MTIGIVDGPLSKIIKAMVWDGKESGKMAFDPALIGKPKSLPMAVTIYGAPKVGKTKLFSEFSSKNTTEPDCFLMLWENPGPTLEGRDDILVSQKLTSFEDGMACLKWVFDNPGAIKKLGCDTITAMYNALEAEVVRENKVASIEEVGGGWGKGVAIVKDRIGKLIRAFEALREIRGIQIIYLGHDKIKTFKRPDGESYNFYGMNMNEECYMLFVNNSDIIAYLDQTTVNVEAKDKHVIVKGTNDRVLRVRYAPAYISGNRYGIEDDLKYVEGTNPLAPWLSATRVVAKIEDPKETY